MSGRLYALLGLLLAAGSAAKECTTDDVRHKTLLGRKEYYELGECTSLDLAEKKIGDKSAQALAEALKENRAVASLILRDNAIGAKGAQALAETLKLKQSFRQLHGII